VTNGLGDRHISASRPKCRVCGSRGRWIVHPPMPRFDGAAWMQ
jgi:hypothetical protein